MRRLALLGVVAGIAALVATTAASARPGAATGAASAAAPGTKLSCKKGVDIGGMAAVTGQGASQGVDQLHWVEFYVSRWNAKHTLKIKLIQGDTQLDPSKASVVVQQFVSDKKMMGIVGPASSSETVAVSPLVQRGGIALVSASATRVSLTDGSLRSYFWRVVPNDGVQGPTDASYMMTNLGVRSGDDVMIVDDQESYSTGLASIVQANLQGKGVDVDHQSISQNQTDFSSLVAKIKSSTKVVFLPFQLAAQTELFAEQMKEQGKSAIVFATDGSFDINKFHMEGAYSSFFAPDVRTVKTSRSLVHQFLARYVGETNPFGAPAYVAAQVVVEAINRACKDGKVSRVEVRKQIAKTRLKNTLLGIPLRFTANGDVADAEFRIFKVTSGKFALVK